MVHHHSHVPFLFNFEALFFFSQLFRFASPGELERIIEGPVFASSSSMRPTRIFRGRTQSLPASAALLEANDEIFEIPLLRNSEKPSVTIRPASAHRNSREPLFSRAHALQVRTGPGPEPFAPSPSPSPTKQRSLLSPSPVASPSPMVGLHCVCFTF